MLCRQARESRNFMIVYNKLWSLLKARNMTKSSLLEVITPAVIAKLGKNQTVNTSTIDKICRFLNVQPSEIMSFEDEYVILNAVNQMGEVITKTVKMMQDQNIPEEEVMRFLKGLPIPEGVEASDYEETCKRFLKGENVFATEFQNYLPK